jgi:hypothetical protein
LHLHHEDFQGNTVNFMQLIKNAPVHWTKGCWGFNKLGFTKVTVEKGAVTKNKGFV